jgi:hypothetical protein
LVSSGKLAQVTLYTGSSDDRGGSSGVVQIWNPAAPAYHRHRDMTGLNSRSDAVRREPQQVALFHAWCYTSIAYRDLVVHDFGFDFDWTRHHILIPLFLFLFRLVLLPDLHIHISSLAGRHRFNVTADRSSDFGAPTASLVLDHLKVVR